MEYRSDEWRVEYRSDEWRVEYRSDEWIEEYRSDDWIVGYRSDDWIVEYRSDESIIKLCHQQSFSYLNIKKIFDPRWNLKNLSRGLNPPKTRFKLSAGLNLETFDTNFKWNQPYLNRGLNLNHRSNSLNSATGWTSTNSKLEMNE